MEETNPWLDPDSGKHKNKKSVRPDKIESRTSKESKVEKDNKVNAEEKLIPGYKKNQNQKVLDFLNILVEDGLDSNLPKSVEDWAIEHFDKQWLEEFMGDLKLLKEEILTSNYFPSQQQLLLLKFVFLLRQGF